MYSALFLYEILVVFDIDYMGYNSTAGAIHRLQHLQFLPVEKLAARDRQTLSETALINIKKY